MSLLELSPLRGAFRGLSVGLALGRVGGVLGGVELSGQAGSRWSLGGDWSVPLLPGTSAALREEAENLWTLGEIPIWCAEKFG